MNSVLSVSTVKAIKSYAYPWYDSPWLSAFMQAQAIIKDCAPTRLQEFVDAFEPLRTSSDFEVVKLPEIMNSSELQEVKSCIESLNLDELEKQELFNFGRLVIHDHPYFNDLQKDYASLVSECVKEPVEPHYNFLSLYNNLGVCKVHLDAPSAKWTLDVCIDQSDRWPIYLSQAQPWPETFDCVDEDYESHIKKDPKNRFAPFILDPGDGIIFSGSSQWHYRDRITRSSTENYCHLIFFHFVPKGASKILEPNNWSEYFGMPELDSVVFQHQNPSAFSLSDLKDGAESEED